MLFNMVHGEKTYFFENKPIKTSGCYFSISNNSKHSSSITLDF